MSMPTVPYGAPPGPVSRSGRVAARLKTTFSSIWRAITPARLQGRVNASMLFIMWGVIPIGSLLGGLLGTTIGLRQTLAVGAVGMSLAFIWVLFSPIRGLRRQPPGLAHEAA